MSWAVAECWVISDNDAGEKSNPFWPKMFRLFQILQRLKLPSVWRLANAIFRNSCNAIVQMIGWMAPIKGQLTKFRSRKGDHMLFHPMHFLAISCQRRALRMSYDPSFSPSTSEASLLAVAKNPELSCWFLSTIWALVSDRLIRSAKIDCSCCCDWDRKNGPLYCCNRWWW